jgi:hypothetical protein
MCDYLIARGSDSRSAVEALRSPMVRVHIRSYKRTELLGPELSVLQYVLYSFCQRFEDQEHMRNLARSMLRPNLFTWQSSTPIAPTKSSAFLLASYVTVHATF